MEGGTGSFDDTFRVSQFKQHLSFLSPTTIKEIEDILTKASEKRTSADLDTLSLLSNSVDVLRPLGDMQRQAIFSVATLKVLKQGEVIHQRGELCNTLYVIFQGSCGVYIEQENLVEEMKAHFGENELSNFQSLLLAPKSTKIRELGPLDSFGNTSLDASGAVQTASISALEKCCLLCVEYSLCQEALNRVENQSFSAKLNFLRSCSVFKERPKVELERISKNLVYKSFSPGACLFRQGEKVGDVYLIRVGKCRIVKFYDDVPVDFGEIGKGSLVGERGLVNLHSGSQVQEYAAIATTHLQTFMIRRTNFYHLINSLPDLRKRLLSIISESFNIEHVSDELSDSVSWDEYKRELSRNTVPARQFQSKLPSIASRDSCNTILKLRQRMEADKVVEHCRTFLSQKDATDRVSNARRGTAIVSSQKGNEKYRNALFEDRAMNTRNPKNGPKPPSSPANRSHSVSLQGHRRAVKVA